MTRPAFDLSHLHALIGDDPDLQNMLIQEFIITLKDGLAKMKTAAPHDNQTWRATAHALKGAAYNMGATQLGDLCHAAQIAADDPQNRAILLNAIHAVFLDIKDSIMYQDNPSR